MEDPPPSRYPMMRSPRGGQHPANSNAHMHFPGRQFGAGNRSIGSRPSGTGHFPSIGGQKRDSSGFAVTGSPARHGGPGQGGSSQDSPEGGNFVKLFVGSVPRTVTEDDIRPLFAEHGNVLEVALIKEKRTGQQQDLQGRTLNGCNFNAWGGQLESAVGCCSALVRCRHAFDVFKFCNLFIASLSNFQGTMHFQKFKFSCVVEESCK